MMKHYKEPIIVKIESQRVISCQDFPYLRSFSTTVENIGVAKDGKRYRFYTTDTSDSDTTFTRMGSGYGYVEIGDAS